jgi:tetratricopeptide (TPR) repeat protein
MQKKNPKKKGQAKTAPKRSTAAKRPAASKSPASKKRSAASKPASAKAAPAKVKKASAPVRRRAAATAASEPAAKPVPASAASASAASASAASASAPARTEGDDRAGIENVMASLTKIFGGRDFLSDADLDAFLDSKIASGEIPPSAALDPLDEAQSLIYEAWNSPEPQRIRLAHRALELSPDCADAYVILAEEEAKTKQQALDFYRKGTEAGQRALGPQFQKLEGKFWEVMETRPYMRARLGLAESLWDSGKREEALDHLRDMLRLNPSDNQGVRYILIQTLLENGADDEIGKWLQLFPRDPSATFKYTHALWMFRREGAGAKANALLDAALKANSHVPPYLLGKKKLPKDDPGSVAPGSDEEAAAYAEGAFDPWHGTLGAVEWLRERGDAKKL